ncbi:MAG: polyribonucleotide nucleotidyltransferase [Candidatus Schekmanbacteria bacterium]|nr:MAG: polyribonucleotide nucleotidyltransferase [Candidatus Schekmanbacteria bacterium]
MVKKHIDLYGTPFIMETGKVAKQANGAVVVRQGDVVVLVTAVTSKNDREGIDFLPFTVEYREKTYAAGKIPGGFFKREGRPNEKEILTSRLIDRPLRPLFPDGYRKDIQIIANVLCTDQENDTDIAAMNGASAALLISDIPFTTPVAAVRVGLIDGKMKINPTFDELDNSLIDIVVAGTRDAVLMVEGESREVSEEQMLEAIFFGHENLLPLIELQEELRKEVGKPKNEVQDTKKFEIDSVIREKTESALSRAIAVREKLARQEAVEKVFNDLLEEINPEEDQVLEFKSAFEKMEKRCVRKMILDDAVRADGRKYDEIRPISCEVGVLPRTHGSSLFTRGETQSLSIVTLGSADDEQRVDALEGEERKAFMLHYNFPPFSVGEVSNRLATGRREIGHGNLAERALKAVMPDSENFPYTVRVVSEILESNGSSSMATVCAGSLALMDAGVPIRKAVAGIAMGLIKEDEKTVILSDILGLEDHCGDMDFKVAGTKDGITAFQMDVKISGVTKEIVSRALEQAKAGRLYILEKMNETIAEPRSSMSEYAPKIVTIHINPSKIGEVIGPGGKNIRSIIEETGAKIDIEDDGRVNVSAVDSASADKAIEIIKHMTEEPEIGKIYNGKVKKIVDFGAFVEILPNTEGLVHISELCDYRVKAVRDVLKEGDIVPVKLIDIDRENRLRLSRKEALRSIGKEKK